MSGILIAASTQGYYFPDDQVQALDFVLSPSVASAELRFANDGDILDQAATDKGDWISPKEYASGSFEIKANSSSPDTPSSGTMDTWLTLDFDRVWGQTQSGFGSTQTDFTIEIRKDGGPTLVTRSCRLIATVDL